MSITIPYNQILCEDCIEGFKKLPDACIDLIVTSPPYFNSNKKYQRGTGVHYDIDVSEPLYTIEDLFEVAYRVIKPDGFFCINLGFSYGETGVMRPFYIIERAKRFGYFPLDVIIWIKDNPIPIHKRLTNAFEYIFVLSKHPFTDYPNSDHMEYITNIIPNIVRSNINKPKEAKFHSTVFPKDIPAFCITHFSKVGDLVCDPFMGSGTTALACLDLRRKYLGYDISPDYVTKATQRIQNYGVSPVTEVESPQKMGVMKYFK